ncbi:MULTISPECIES: hypothetical protein [Herpetosiphon]|uniref:Uncharacterized protein n=1 Tax=Herpetosiphon geysericola TaxID=70996 RepID=A0A0P6XM48_9CHLR|nr:MULTISPECIES: hypothetical protein [Herpetosiphon]KPL81424.1 hypothetical protein SE18_22560 [Herpetosiphon geysericola]MBM7841864.1 hypothetical protein [Herpetosiphon giganteus]
MQRSLPSAKQLGLAALATLILGIGLLYAGALTIAPLALLSFVVLSIVAMVSLTAHDIEDTILKKGRSE